MNNEPTKVMAKKGSRDVHPATLGEMGETTNVVAYSNTEGNFLPPYCILKGKRKKPDNVTVVASTSESYGMSTPAVASTGSPRILPLGLSPMIASTSAEHGISCLEAISPIPLVEKRKPSVCRKQSSEILTESQRRANM
ncbi:hypothetical protein TNCV_1235711 [Trichonephila clavipes]|nr:hypothetical protein TNCV_1235711 [Trichonephila clavipes]